MTFWHLKNQRVSICVHNWFFNILFYKHMALLVGCNFFISPTLKIHIFLLSSFILLSPSYIILDVWCCCLVHPRYTWYPFPPASAYLQTWRFFDYGCRYISNLYTCLGYYLISLYDYSCELYIKNNPWHFQHLGLQHIILIVLNSIALFLCFG